MFGFFKAAINPLAEVAKEWIQTDKESAEAKAVMVKALDPNGKMRAQISSDVLGLYKLYIVTSLSLLALEFFGVGDVARVASVTTKLVDLFLPITGMVSIIVSASFGVNAVNSYKGK